MKTETEQTHGGKPQNGDGKPETGPQITITIDGKEQKIHRGRATVAEIKAAGQVPLAYDLEQLVDGKLVPLADDASVTLKGGEVFLSHPKDGGAS